MYLTLNSRPCPTWRRCTTTVIAAARMPMGRGGPSPPRGASQAGTWGRSGSWSSCAVACWPGSRRSWPRAGSTQSRTVATSVPRARPRRDGCVV